MAGAQANTVTPFTRLSSAQQVADTLRDELLHGRIAPGTRLLEVQIATSYDVSRHTVREALRSLEVDGLVQHNLHHGVVVAELREADVSDVYRARAALELSGVRAAASAPPDWLDGLRACVAMLSSADDMAEVADADLEFHRTLVAAIGSTRLDRVYTRLQAELRLSRAWAGRERGAPEQMVATHAPVVDSLERGDLEAAAKHVEAINREGERRLQEAIKVRTQGRSYAVPTWPPPQEA